MSPVYPWPIDAVFEGELAHTHNEKMGENMEGCKGRTALMWVNFTHAGSNNGNDEGFCH